VQPGGWLVKGAAAGPQPLAVARCPAYRQSMASDDLSAKRLFVRAPLVAGQLIDLDQGKVNHVVNVLRMAAGDRVRVFNGSDGEWDARLVTAGRRRWQLAVDEQTRPQPAASDIDYVFAPLKQARLDYVVEKAVEMGVGRLRPVLTRYGQVTRINRSRIEANAIGAAEQCGILTVPAIAEPKALAWLLAEWADGEAGRRIVFCDEAATGGDPLAILTGLPKAPLAALVGPEGGFADDERAFLLALPFVTALPLGPRILRADTAAVAVLALIQATLGDWSDGTPRIADRTARR